MRTMLIVVLAGAILVSGDRGLAQSSELSGGIYWVPNPSRTVTLSRNGSGLTSFTFPAGTFLSASYDDRQPTVISPGRWEFHGDFVLRAQPAVDVPGQLSGRRFEEIMSQAPLVLTLKDVDVLIENVNP